MVTVVRAIGLATVQDLGWIGHRGIGLPLGGAMDPDGLRTGNALVGNPDGAAGLEIAHGELALTFSRATAAAVTGLATVRLDGVEVPAFTSLAVAKNSRLDVVSAPGGRFVTIAIRGGIAVPPLLGSRSTYLPTKIGGLEGRRLATGDRLECGPAPDRAAPARGTAVATSVNEGPIRLAPGPQGHLFGDDAFALLAESPYRIGEKSDRMGSRLEGRPLAIRMAATLPSEATCLGAIQVPDDGLPIVILRDGPTVGGYPKIGAVISADLTRFAQVPPRSSVRFAWVTLAQAEHAWRQSIARITGLLARLREPALPG